MTTYRNRYFVKRDYECTNLVACVAETAPQTPDNQWIEDDDCILEGLTQLYIQNGVRFYGWL